MRILILSFLFTLNAFAYDDRRAGIETGGGGKATINENGAAPSDQGGRILEEFRGIKIIPNDKSKLENIFEINGSSVEDAKLTDILKRIKGVRMSDGETINKDKIKSINIDFSSESLIDGLETQNEDYFNSLDIEAIIVKEGLVQKIKRKFNEAKN